ncbi:MAG: hypothetical protein IT410_02185 [Candidatus Doudnabacteria bacterium]|nr:hypothetical protein [Candidatus Doudnabacteria bacterium]
MLTPLTKRKIKHGTKFVTQLVEATGIPLGYATSVAWFAERMVLAGLCLAVLSFAAGAIFVLKLSEPIADSNIYTQAERRAVLAQDGVKVFSQQVIDVASPVFGLFVKQHREERDIEAERLVIRKQRLKAYLENKRSPFAEEDAAIEAFASSKNMKMMVAISFVESTFGQNCYYYNCSGIGGTPPSLRKYNGYAEWIKDFDSLLERRYKDVPPEKFIGLYVQPGSPNWIYGVNQVIDEFEELDIEATSYTGETKPLN